MKLTELERHCVSAGMAPSVEDSALRHGELGWQEFLVSFALEVGRWVRPLRLGDLKSVVEIKDDGSPVTPMEKEIEVQLRQRVASFAPDARVLGEETGGGLPEVGEAVAVDPIDGTWALINRTESFSVTLALFRDGEPEIGVVLNPATGELSYASRGEQPRLIQLPTFGEDATAYDLPLQRVTEGGLLVHLHPGPNSQDLAAVLMQSWRERKILLVRSVGGSPCLGLADAAKGTFIYVNRWSDAPACPFDLAAGELLIRGAGGIVLDLQGHEVSLVRHAGPFVAGVNREDCFRVVELLRQGRS